MALSPELGHALFMTHIIIVRLFRKLEPIARRDQLFLVEYLWDLLDEILNNDVLLAARGALRDEQLTIGLVRHRVRLLFLDERGPKVAAVLGRLA